MASANGVTNWVFMFFRSLVTQWIPSANKFWNKSLEIYPLSPKSLPKSLSTKASFFSGVRSSVLHKVDHIAGVAED
jgi:hypothetical protein